MTDRTSLLAHDVENNRQKREELAKAMAEWEAKHGQTVCHAPTVHRAADEGFRREQAYVPDR